MKKIILSFCLSLTWVSLAHAAAENAGRGESPLIEPGLFQVTAQEQEKFALALPGGPEGLRRAKEGPAVYCQFDEQSLEFRWHQTPPGLGPENLAQGHGEITLKYAGEEMALERYRGEFNNGFREGRGELLARELYSDDAFIYRGDFRQGRLEGRGVYVSAAFGRGGEAPFIYQGEFRNDTFHGQGVMTDLDTGRIIHNGLWFEGFPFKGGQAGWARANR